MMGGGQKQSSGESALGSHGGKVAVVTGGGAGIGRHYCLALAANGARVVVTDIDERSAASVAEELRDLGCESFSIGGDVSDAAEVDAMAKAVHNQMGPAEILINNAAMFVRSGMSRVGFDALAEAEWDRMMDVNLKGPWLMCRAFVPHMQQLGRGKIVNISSGTAFKGSTNRIHYVTSKAGILGFTRVLARELGADGITVNCIAPGSTLSEDEGSGDAVKYRQRGVADRAIRRVQSAEDLVGAMLFLTSQASDFVTGQTLVVDGGSVMR